LAKERKQLAGFLSVKHIHDCIDDDDIILDDIISANMSEKMKTWNYTYHHKPADFDTF
jgi:hypothetical protein